MFLVRLFQNIRMRWKVLFLVAVFVLMSIVVGLVGIFSNSAVKRDLVILDQQYTAIALNITQADGYVRDLRSIVAMALLTDDPTEARQYASDFTRKRDETLALAAHYAENLINSRRADATKGLLAQWGIIEPMYQNILELAQQYRRDEAYAIFHDDNTQRDINKMMSMFADEADALNAEYEQRRGELVALLDRNTSTMIIVLVCIFIAGIITNLLVSFSMTRPLVKLQGAVKVLSKGDMTKDIDYYGSDEIASIGEGLTGLSGVLNTSIGGAVAIAAKLGESSRDFADMADQTNAAVEQFRASLDEMTTDLGNMASASEEINASVREVSTGAHTTAEKGTDIARLVDEAMTVGDDGMEAVRKVVAGVSKVSESSESSATSIIELGERARQIQSFVSQIGGIADQTNLLALNAAIEAARAGEAGRGFAVVAEEVRKLAEDSNAAAKSIADLAGTITSDIDNIVEAAQDNAKKSSDAVELSGSTEEAIEKMIKILSGISEATQDLAAISEQQAASSTEISETIMAMADRVANSAHTGETLRESAAEIGKSSEKIALGAEDLRSMSSDLTEDLAFFTVSEAKQAKSGSRSGGPALKALPR